MPSEGPSCFRRPFSVSRRATGSLRCIDSPWRSTGNGHRWTPSLSPSQRPPSTPPCPAACRRRASRTSSDPKPSAKLPATVAPYLAPIVSRGDFPTPGPIWRPQLPPPAESLGHFFLKVPRWGTAGAYRRRHRRATDGRPSKCPAAWGGVGRRGLPSCALSGGEVKEKKSRPTLPAFPPCLRARSRCTCKLIQV